MDVNSLNLYNIFKTKKLDTQTKPPFLSAQNNYTNLAPLKQDTISFKGVDKTAKNSQKVKKSDFNPIDHLVVEKYRVNISGFKSTDDLQTWAESKIKKDFIDNDYNARLPETVKERQSLMEEWIKYVTKENSAYTPAIQLLILDAVTKDLKANNDTLPPVLNRGVLADTVHEVSQRAKNNPKADININKLYRTKLRAMFLGTDDSGSAKTDFTGWIVIPSQKHDPENFKDNVGKLKELSHTNWCTKSFNAEPYLKEGDFHVYLENGKPKLGVRFVGEAIEEIQGARNNSKIPQPYLETVQNHIKENKFVLRKTASDEMTEAEKMKQKCDEIKAEIGEEALLNNDAAKILPFFGIEVWNDEDGKLIISNYHQPSSDYSFEDLGIDENIMFNQIKEIEGTADFDGTALTEIRSLETIGGDAKFRFSKLRSLGSIKTIEGNLRIDESNIADLGDLEYVGKNVDFFDTELVSTGNLEYIGGNASFEGSNIESLGKIKEIGRSLSLSGSKVSDLGELQKIGRDANFDCAYVESLKNLKRIGGNANFKNSDLRDIGKLEYIAKDADFSYTHVGNVDNLKRVGGFIDIEESGLEEEDIEHLIDYRHYATYDKKGREVISMEDFERMLENM